MMAFWFWLFAHQRVERWSEWSFDKLRRNLSLPAGRLLRLAPMKMELWT